jgi:hypothetical protein
MDTVIRAGRRAAAACLLIVLLAPVAADAQGGAAPPTPLNQGPMTVERVKSGFLVAPDFKVTEFDSRVSELAGGYAGWLSDQTFFVGGGGYWLANRSRDREMAYGGLVLGWFAGADRRIGFGAKGLIGGGRATLVSSFGDIFDDDHDVRRLEVGPRGPSVLLPPPIDVNVRVRDDFFVAEPEATVVVGLARHFRLTAGAGYRLIGGARGLRTRLQGATGSVALQIGGG